MIAALLLWSCAADEPAWAVLHASIVPSATGMEGTQTWEFFSVDWSPDAGDRGYLCARAQTVVGTRTAAPSCPECRAVWANVVQELDTDCPSGLAESADFAGPALYAVRDVAERFADEEPWSDEGFGWAVAFDDGELVDVGFAYAEALDAGGDAPPGLAQGEAYTLWPAVAWAR